MCPSATWGLSRRPLTASAADEALFVDRVTEATTIRKEVDLALNTFLTGPACLSAETVMDADPLGRVGKQVFQLRYGNSDTDRVGTVSLC